MRLTNSRVYYRPSPPKMPPGLVELMEGLTRDVLKNNPTDIHGFCAGHIQHLLEIRDGPQPKKPLSLQQKIAKAQEKVRQRAARRRQQYDNELLQRSKSLETGAPENETETVQSTITTGPKTQVIGDQELANSSEIEISHEPDNTDVPRSSDANTINDDIKTEKHETETANTDESIPLENNSKNDIVTESTKETGDNETLAVLPTSEPPDTKAEVVNELSSAIKTGNNAAEPTDHEQKTSKDEEKITTDEQKTSTDEEKTTTDEQKTTTEEQKTTTDKQKTFTEELRTTNDDQKTNTDEQKTTVDEQKTNIDEQKTTADEQKTNIDEQKITTDERITTTDEQKTNTDKQKTTTDEEKTNTELQAVESKDHLTDTRVETGIASSVINNEKESAQHELEAKSEDGDNVENTSLKSDSQNSDLKEVTNLSNASTIEISKDNLPLDEERIHETNDVQNIPPLQQPLDGINTDHTNNITDIEQLAVETTDSQSNPDINTITMRFQESPALDLQSSLLNSDLLESLSATDTDSDATTASLINHDSIKVELKSITTDDDLSNPAKPAETIEDFQVSNNIETDLKKSNDKNNHINALEKNQDDETESEEKPFIESNNVRNDIDNNEDSTSTKLDENLQINNQDTNMDLETAAITIQKVFRTFMFKSRNSTFDDDAAASDETSYLEEDDKTKVECDFPVKSSLNMDRRCHGLTRMDTVLQTVNEEKSLSLSTDDSSTLSSAATVIQAHVRGFLVRNKLNSNKTISTNSLAASNPSLPSLEMDNDLNKNKTVLNIHIVPEGGNYLSRDESLLTSMDLSLDSPPSSINLHPLGNDKISERRKQLKREDAIQSISPPSNNSGKLSEDIDSVKEMPLNDLVVEHQSDPVDSSKDDAEGAEIAPVENSKTENITAAESNGEDSGNVDSNVDQSEINLKQKRATLSKYSSDEMDVVSPSFVSNEDKSDLKLMHSGEFHDAVLPTKVSRSDTSVASEFKNVLVYFLLWNNS